jgi:hypothetical protein
MWLQAPLTARVIAVAAAEFAFNIPLRGTIISTGQSG